MSETSQAAPAAKSLGAASGSTRDQLICHAQTLMRERGYNGFSYRDLAEHVGVKTASIHYHFPQKEDLLLAAVEDYTGRAMQAVRGVDESLPAQQRLARYAALFTRQAGDQVCMCGMLTADFNSVPDSVRHALQNFYRQHENWLAKVFAEGARDGTLKSSGDPQTDARTLFSALQGALLASRLFQSPDRVHDVFASVQRAHQTQTA
ncbi:TetR/AcrR family transcriptional regulator [Bordetella genomosp. 13]|uniref:TetR/AcrR family transcriptional regulator n=1 Tax=Bordetella genomosp. 13 TaxID=463040 RepID=UPI0011A28DC0|nr:TetR/AcrR family transcriptional regulator [Bordetella genomosp. 13]